MSVNNNINKAKWYETRRNELLKLIEETSSLEIQEKFANELANVKKKCLENQFEIVLIGEFQGGKSTTFNTICDGRDLSPRGLGGGGIKTSAAIISAQNISDGETCNGLNEWAEITFKSKYDIQLGMFELVHDYLTAHQGFRTSVMKKNNLTEDKFKHEMINSDSFAKLLDLDDTIHRQALKECLNAYWQEWEEDHAILDEDTKDLLRISTLQERFYGTNEYKECVKNNIRKIYDFQKLIAFPNNWAIKWNDGKSANFTFEEAAFVFIGRTLLRIQSQNLASLGCRITDSPGLGANKYDTTMAKSAIIDADAVWYLIGGEKQIGEKDLESLNTIKLMGMDPKLIGSVNLKGKHKQLLEKVYPVTEAILKDNGFSFNLHPYNARLAFLAAQGRRISENQNFSDYEIECIKIDADSEDESLETMWCDMVSDVAVTTGEKELKNTEAANSDSIEAVLKASFFSKIMDNLSDKIVSKKTKSILIDNGSTKATNALLAYEGVLKMNEDAALEREEEWKQKVEQAQETLNNFIAKSKEMLKNSSFVRRKKDQSENLAHDLVKSILTNDSFIDKLAYSIAEAKAEAESHVSFGSYENEIKAKISNKVQNLFSYTMLATFEKWKTEDNASKAWEELKEDLNYIAEVIKNNWDTEIEDQEYLKNIKLKLPSINTIKNNLTSLQKSILENPEIRQVLKQNIIITLANQTILALNQALVRIQHTIEYLKESFINFINNQSSHAEEWKKIKEKSDAKKINLKTKLNQLNQEYKKNFIKEVKEKIIENLKQEFQKADLITTLSKNFIYQFENIQCSIEKEINNSLNELQTNFQSNVNSAKENFILVEAERQKLAEKNKKIRIEQIEPIRKKIERFEQQVSIELQD